MFPERKVTVLARRIIIIPSQLGWLTSNDLNIASLVINTVAPPGSIPTKPKIAGNRKDGYWAHNQRVVDAQDGEAAVDGGSVLLCAQVQPLGFRGSTSPTLSLLMMPRKAAMATPVMTNFMTTMLIPPCPAAAPGPFRPWSQSDLCANACASSGIRVRCIACRLL